MAKMKMTLILIMTLGIGLSFNSLWAKSKINQDSSQEEAVDEYGFAKDPSRTLYDFKNRIAIIEDVYEKNQCQTVIELAASALEFKKQQGLKNVKEQEGDLYYYMGYCYKELGDYTQARPYLNQAIKIRHQLKNNYDELVALGSLASLERALGNYEKSYRLYQDNIKTRRKIFGKDSHYLPGILNNYGQIFLDAKSWEKAESVYREAEAILIENDAENISLFQVIRLNHFWITLGRGEISTAENLLVNLDKFFTSFFEAEDPLRLEFTDSKANFYLAKGEYTQAENFAKEAIKILSIAPQSDLGPRFLLTLGKIYHAQGKYDQAIETYDRAYKIFSKNVKSTHPFLGEILVARAETLLKQDPNHAQAKKEMAQGKSMIAKAFAFMDKI